MHRCHNILADSDTLSCSYRLRDLSFCAAQCPEGWLAVGWSCYRVSAGILTWTEAQRECERVAPGVQLANLKTDVDFLSISSHLQSHDHNLLLWTALNDRQVPLVELWRPDHTQTCTHSNPYSNHLQLTTLPFSVLSTARGGAELV
uniref:C-type lectin domain-containing protein n=1 Tax=Electrophorus electricus TaxID=8005 RepID=A0A4W4G8S1_ELEEL